MDADGSDATQLTRGDGSASDAAWSPDGTRIAFSRCRRTCDVYVIDADGTRERRLTNGEQPKLITRCFCGEIRKADDDKCRECLTADFESPTRRVVRGPQPGCEFCGIAQRFGRVIFCRCMCE